MSNSLNVGYLGYAINVRRCPLIINYYPLNGIHIANRKFQETVGSRWSWTASGIGWFDELNPEWKSLGVWDFFFIIIIHYLFL